MSNGHVFCVPLLIYVTLSLNKIPVQPHANATRKQPTALLEIYIYISFQAFISIFLQSLPHNVWFVQFIFLLGIWCKPPKIRYICPLVTNLGIFTLTQSWNDWLKLPCLLAGFPHNKTFYFQTFEFDVRCTNSVVTYQSVRRTYKHTDLCEGRKS